MQKVELLRRILDDDIFDCWYYSDGNDLTIEEITNLQLIKTLKEYTKEFISNNKKDYLTGPR